jgi:hypothetical protein
MASPRPPSLAQAHHYRLPELLHDIRLLDLLELCGTTVQTSRLLQLSQPLVGQRQEGSRRYRLLSEDFGLVRDRRQLWGCGYGTSAAMRLLRLGCRAHRLAAGVARMGSDLLHHPLLADCPWLLPTPQRFRAAANWLELVRQGVLDGALISGLELEEAEGLNHQELELLPLGQLPLALAFCPEAPVLVGYEIESIDADGNLFFIEVKGRVDGADSVTLTINEVNIGRNAPQRFRLALVTVEGDRASSPVYVSGLDWGLPGFGDTQITKNLQQLLVAGRAPH